MCLVRDTADAAALENRRYGAGPFWAACGPFPDLGGVQSGFRIGSRPDGPHLPGTYSALGACPLTDGGSLGVGRPSTPGCLDATGREPNVAQRCSVAATA